jgi:hypothetical protein
MNCKQKSRTQVEGNSKRRYWKIRWKYIGCTDLLWIGNRDGFRGEKTVRLCVCVETYQSHKLQHSICLTGSEWGGSNFARFYTWEKRASGRAQSTEARGGEGGKGGAWGLCTIIVPERGKTIDSRRQNVQSKTCIMLGIICTSTKIYTLISFFLNQPFQFFADLRKPYIETEMLSKAEPCCHNSMNFSRSLIFFM